ncbi:acyl-CoA dehydrogenase [Lactobacillus delbrueckii]|uniref:acyl-CoA dehydrogenase n=1 Tax=Lactobacillus delbrueckii TaxID=1584 RepID=UPI000681A4B6|nr:acyl-CoA dehydrogenase [Lactobacillus delbrueckii]APP02237.1 acyl-CoA dehydrogenase [Lactobacillus delbrueckii subsp. indicus]KNE31331.1 acyl-CoA dehydrogenase [Lactobacillus delbrueckii subsp. indicus]KRL78884.1 Acyl-CoA dehydrogenase [Lactobacillus delbrueckii subsp. indicus DSM 15996]
MTNETELLQAVQQLADKSVAPFDLQIDRQAKLPNGLLKAKIPKEYDGLDVSAATAGLALLGPFDLIFIGATIADYLRDRKFNSGKQKQDN